MTNIMLTSSSPETLQESLMLAIQPILDEMVKDRTLVLEKQLHETKANLETANTRFEDSEKVIIDRVITIMDQEQTIDVLQDLNASLRRDLLNSEQHRQLVVTSHNMLAGLIRQLASHVPHDIDIDNKGNDDLRLSATLPNTPDFASFVGGDVEMIPTLPPQHAEGMKCELLPTGGSGNVVGGPIIKQVGLDKSSKPVADQDTTVKAPPPLPTSETHQLSVTSAPDSKKSLRPPVLPFEDLLSTTSKIVPNVQTESQFLIHRHALQHNYPVLTGGSCNILVDGFVRPLPLLSFSLNQQDIVKDSGKFLCPTGNAFYQIFIAGHIRQDGEHYNEANTICHLQKYCQIDERLIKSLVDACPCKVDSQCSCAGCSTHILKPDHFRPSHYISAKKPSFGDVWGSTAAQTIIDSRNLATAVLMPATTAPNHLTISFKKGNLLVENTTLNTNRTVTAGTIYHIPKGTLFSIKVLTKVKGFNMKRV